MNDGASFTEFTVMVKLCVAETFTSGGVDAPLSTIRSVMVATPFSFAAGVYVRTPAGETSGPAENSVGFELLVISKLTVCRSLVRSGLIAVAQRFTDWRGGILVDGLIRRRR